MSNANTNDKQATDWERLRNMSEAEAEANAASDPDAQPMTDEQLAKMRRPSLAKRIRRKLRLTQEEFAERYRIPIGTIRDWEQGRNELSAPAISLLKAIAADPEAVAKAQLEDA